MCLVAGYPVPTLKAWQWASGKSNHTLWACQPDSPGLIPTMVQVNVDNYQEWIRLVAEYTVQASRPGSGPSHSCHCSSRHA